MLYEYRLKHLTDPAYPPFRLRAGGDVPSAVQADWEHFLRTLVEFEAGAVSAAVRLSYRPAGEGEALRQRLTASLLAAAHRADAAPGLEALMERGPLRRFLSLEACEPEPVSGRPFHAVCHVVRRLSVLEPTVTAELNAKALPAYGALLAFEPREENDYLLLDSVLSGIRERVLIDICVAPIDTARDLAEHTRYLSSLLQISRSWDSDDEDLDSIKWQRETDGFPSLPRVSVKPLRVRDPLADEVLRRQQRFHESLLKPHLQFHIRVFAQTQAVARLVASTVAESAFADGSYQLVDRALAGAFRKQAVSGLENVTVLHVPEEEQFGDAKELGPCRALLPLMHVAPIEELTGAFRLPIAGHASPYCIRKNTDPPSWTASELICLGHDDEALRQAGEERPAFNRRGILIESLCKHFFLCGMSGSGKTTAAYSVMSQLSERRIPFLVFEPAKTDYRLLKCLKKHANPPLRRLAREMEVYTPGKESISPFRFNPLQIPEGIGRDEHIEHVLSCFKAAMPMSGPLPALLGEALEEVYEENLGRDRPPRMVDLYEAARAVLARKGYSGEVDSNMRGALEVRLGLLTRRSIGRVFQCTDGVPSIRGLIQGFTLIELAALPTEQACLLTLFILTAIREQIRSIPHTSSAPRLVIFLEEAHNLVGRGGKAQASEENADPKAFTADFIRRMLAELRALGVAIGILDQLPSAVAPEVIKQTGSKLCFREVDQEEREAIGGTMLFGPIEMEETARLRPGEAYFYTEGYFGPQRIRTPNLHAEFGLPQPPVGDAVLPHIRRDAWFERASMTRLTAEAGQLLQEMDRFDDVRMSVDVRAAKLVAARPQILKDAPSDERRTRLLELAGQVSALRDELAEAFRLFDRERYRPLLPVDTATIPDDALRALYENLVARFEMTIRPDTQACTDLLVRLASQCESDLDRRKGV